MLKVMAQICHDSEVHVAWLCTAYLRNQHRLANVQCVAVREASHGSALRGLHLLLLASCPSCHCLYHWLFLMYSLYGMAKSMKIAKSSINGKSHLCLSLSIGSSSVHGEMSSIGTAGYGGYDVSASSGWLYGISWLTSAGGWLRRGWRAA